MPKETTRKRSTTPSKLSSKKAVSGPSERKKAARRAPQEPPVRVQDVVDTLTENYMPYAMSVIVSRALPEIDGFKPAHRKLLYTMYKMGLLTKPRTKSANIVGQTMRLNPHGDQAIYETMVRMTRGNESLLLPLIDSKGNFGKVYSRDMAYAASRYTEAKLETVCEELFREIEKDAVLMTDNYDGTMKEPALLPVSFPIILANANTGIAVGMASSICSFNLTELCHAAIAYIKDPSCDFVAIMPAPDFSTGGYILEDKKAIEEIYETGRGAVTLQAKWNYVKKGNLIEVSEIPYTTTLEAIIDRIRSLMESGKITEISDVRDESDLSGLKLTIDLQRGINPEKLMSRLFSWTPLQDNFNCNMNVLINGRPQVLGVRDILKYWTVWRVDVKRKELSYELQEQEKKLHLLEGLNKILMDIDLAIRIIRETKKEAHVILNLMNAFGIDQKQAEYVSEIKLKNINQEYILKQTKNSSALKKMIEKLEETLSSDKKIRDLICKELENVATVYGRERKTKILSQE